MSTLPDGAYLAALAGVRPLGPRRLRRLLTHHEPADAHAALMGEAPLAPALATSFTPVVLDACRHELATRDPAVCWAGCADVGIDVVALGDDRYPAVLVHDPFPPAVLFLRGDPAALAVRRVGVVGTRNATRQGLDI
nr:DNA-protecting protein DprA [Ilumatobacteraceae bacterium]